MRRLTHIAKQFTTAVSFKQFKSFLLLPFLCIGFTQITHAAPTSEALTYWDTSEENNTQSPNNLSIDHNAWQNILDKYLIGDHPSGINRFDYKSVNDADRKKLQQYINSLEDIDPRSFNRAEQKAYWINLYNALTVALILDNYPVKSITKLGKKFFSFGPWDDELVEIQGQPLTLNDIEHRILRPIFKDNRIHYAVNCASLSCPNLATKAFTAENTDDLLEQGAEQYINHSRGVSFEGGELKVSSIYHWYKVDFGDNDKKLIAHFIRYAKPALAAQLLRYQGDIEHDYDWQLNEP